MLKSPAECPIWVTRKLHMAYLDQRITRLWRRGDVVEVDGRNVLIMKTHPFIVCYRDGFLVRCMYFWQEAKTVYNRVFSKNDTKALTGVSVRIRMGGPHGVSVAWQNPFPRYRIPDDTRSGSVDG